MEGLDKLEVKEIIRELLKEELQPIKEDISRLNKANYKWIWTT